MMSYQDQFENIVTHCDRQSYQAVLNAGSWTCVSAQTPIREAGTTPAFGSGVSVPR
jgi:hypothetical protein